MSDPHASKILELTISKFPQHLLVPGIDNEIHLQVKNMLPTSEDFKLSFEGEHLTIDLEPEDFKNKVNLKPGENKEVSLHLTPIADGSGKLIINAYWLQLVEYIVPVQKVRLKAAVNKIKHLLKNHTQFLPREVKDVFDLKDYLFEVQKSDVKKLEKDLKSIRSDQEQGLQQDILQNGNEKSKRSKGSINAINNQLAILAKNYLSIGEFYKALETSLQISDENLKLDLYHNLLRAQSIQNLQEIIEIVKKLVDAKRKEALIQQLINDHALIESNRVKTLLELIKEPSKKEEVLINCIAKISTSVPEVALDVTNYIRNESDKVNILFDLIKIFYEKKNLENVLQIAKMIVEIVLSSQLINLIVQENEHPIYILFTYAIDFIAEIENPSSADTVIKRINSENLKERIVNDLNNQIYETVNEKRTKLEPSVVFSQYYLINAVATNVSEDIRKFAALGGNISPNILENMQDFQMIIVSSFNHSFSMFPFLDRIYMDLKYEAKKSIGYYIFPSPMKENNEGSNILVNSLKRFITSLKLAKKKRIINLDFIPYLGKPTVILADDGTESNTVKALIAKKLGDRVNIFIDESLFKGGQMLDSLVNVFDSHNVAVVNFIISYEFLNDYGLLRALFESIA
jgi:tetratricopeptide (TPR) repeat protein